MTGSFEANPYALRAMQPQFADLASQVTAAVTAMQQEIDKEGECWGKDKVGEEFAKGYSGNAKTTQDSMGSLAKMLSGMGDAMTTIANSLEQQQAESAAALNKKTTEI